jgi:hypothetical protein
MRDLVRLGMWDEEMREAIMAANGSIQGIEVIPEHIRNVYKTAYEISQKVIIDMSADRGAYICQSQSLNVFMESATFSKLSSMHFYAWQKGLKTGMYYLRSKARPTRSSLHSARSTSRSLWPMPKLPTRWSAPPFPPEKRRQPPWRCRCRSRLQRARCAAWMTRHAKHARHNIRAPGFKE